MLQFMQVNVSSAHGPVLLLILHVGRTGLPDDHSTSVQPAAATVPVQPAVLAPPAALSYAAAAARAWPSYPAPPIAPVRHHVIPLSLPLLNYSSHVLALP